MTEVFCHKILLKIFHFYDKEAEIPVFKKRDEEWG